MRNACGSEEPRRMRPLAGAWPGRRRNWPMPASTITKLSMMTWPRRSPSWVTSSGVTWKGGTMLDELKEEQIVNKVGGRFKLSTLIQKRMVALNTGARPLVEVRGGDKLTIVIQEILQDKIYLDMSGQLQTRGPSGGDAARRAMLTDISDVSGGDD